VRSKEKRDGTNSFDYHHSFIAIIGIGILYFSSNIWIGSRDHVDAVLGGMFEYFLARLILDLIVAFVLIGIQYLLNLVSLRIFGQKNWGFKKMLFGCLLIYFVASVVYITTDIVMVYKSVGTEDKEL
jgi:hypothetical protein